MGVLPVYTVFASAKTDFATLEEAGWTEAELLTDKNLLNGYVLDWYKVAGTLTAGKYSYSIGSIDENGAETPAAATAYSGSPQNLTDGAIANADATVNGTKFWNSDKTANSTMFYDLIVRLKAPYKNVSFLIADAASDSMRMTDYSVYASDSADTLWTGTPVVSHAASSERFSVIELGSKAVSYIGVRIYSCCTTAWGSANPSAAYLRLSEIAAWVNQPVPVSNVADMASAGYTDADLATSANAFLGMSYAQNTQFANLPAGSFTIGLGSIAEDGTETTAVQNNGNANLLRFVDGSLTSGNSDFNLGPKFWTQVDGVWTPATDMYYEILFHLDGKYDLESLIVADPTTANQALTDFNVYIGDTYEELFADKPIARSLSNVKRITKLDLSGKAAKWVGIRIYGACTSTFAHSNGSYPRTNEIALFATKRASAQSVATIEETGYTDADLTTSSNAFYGMTYTGSGAFADIPANSFATGFGTIAEDGTETSKIVSGNNATRLIDGTYGLGAELNLAAGAANKFWVQDETSAWVPNTNIFVDVVYHLDGKYDLENLLVIDPSSADQALTDYDVYIGDSYADLFNGTPAYEEVANVKRFNKMALTGKSAEWVGIRIYGACTSTFAHSNGSYPRTNEIALFAIPQGVTATATVESPETSSATTVSVDKKEIKPGDVVTFTTENRNEKLEFKGWKKGDAIVSTDATYSVTAGYENINLVAVYEYRASIIVNENFEANIITTGSIQGIDTPANYGITARDGAYGSKVMKVDSNASWNYFNIYNTKVGGNIFALTTVKENTAYKLSYYYYVESVTDASKPIFHHYVNETFKRLPNVENDTTFFEDLGDHCVYATETGKWLKKELYFYTYDYANINKMLFRTATVNPSVFYVDELTIEECAVVDADFDAKAITTNFATSKNHVGSEYKVLYGAKDIAPQGKYTFAPATEGIVITSFTVDGEAVTPDSNGIYTVEITADTSFKIETASAEGYTTINLDQKEGTGKFQGITAADNALVGKQGEEFKFTFTTSENAAPVVTANGETVTSDAEGVYSITLAGDVMDVKIECVGDEYRGTDGKDAKGYDLTKYVQEVYDIPLWEGNIVYHETVTIYEGRTSAKLVYPIENIISVRSGDLKKAYTWGIDYDVNENGELVFLEGNSFECYNGDIDISSPALVTDKGNLYSYAIDVTYTHSETWPDGYQGTRVESKLNELPKLTEKLKNKEDIDFVFYGASSTVGWSSSGLKELDSHWTNSDGTVTATPDYIYVDPYVPTWPRQVVNKLRSDWGYTEDGETNINFYNRSRGGKKASDAANDVTLAGQLGDLVPDVLVLGFSGNDGGDPAFKSSLIKIIEYARTLNPDCEIIIASSSLPLDETTKGYSLARVAEFEEIYQQYKGQGVIVAPYLTLANELYQTKVGCDFMANNYNHVNDFGARAFTNTFAGLLEYKEVKFTVTVTDRCGNTLLTVPSYTDSYTLSEAEIAQAVSKLSTIYGYEFTGWNMDITEEITADTTISAVYSKVEKKHNVTITDGESVETLSLDFDASYIVTAKGEGFSYWMDKVSGTVVSTSKQYMFYVPGEFHLEAVYNATAEVSAVVLNSAVNIVTSGEEFNLYFTGVATLPEGAELLETGIIYTDLASNATAENLVIGTEAARVVYSATNIQKAGPFMIILKGVAAERTRYARAVLKYTLNGETVTEYSDCIATGITPAAE